MTMTEKINLLDKDFTGMQQLMSDMGQESFRAEQLFNWIYDKKVDSFRDMVNLPDKFLKRLEESCEISPLKIIRRQVSEDGTEKFLLKLKDGSSIESVFIPAAGGRNSICLSSQTGCRMGCAFCATERLRKGRNLSAGEMVNQVLTVEKTKNKPVSNAVFMGMGEPLDNYFALLKGISILNHKGGLNIGMRKITVSTCGLVPKIYSLAEEKLQLTLAVSLNASTDELRSRIMPVNKKYPIKKLMEACRHYASKTGRRVSFEYVMMEGRNDSFEQAKKLARLLEGTLSHVNLIPFNPLPGSPQRESRRKAFGMFKSELEKRKVPVSVRKERGRDIDAACGQLKGE